MAQVDITAVLQALDLVYNPATDNDVRRQASQYLDQVKNNTNAAEHGFVLGQDQSLSPQVRHFGLSLIEHVICHADHGLSDEQQSRLRNGVVQLGQHLRRDDPSFIRNKIAGLWIEMAKRTWALDWYDLDELLVRMWSQGLLFQGFVLTVLENLSEDIFARDDAAAVLRGRDLNSAMIEVMTSSQDYAGGLKIGSVIHKLRYGEEGWLVRLAQFIGDSLESATTTPPVKDVLLKGLATLRSIFGWVMTPAIVHSQILFTACSCLSQHDSDIMTVSLSLSFSSEYS